MSLNDSEFHGFLLLLPIYLNLGAREALNAAKCQLKIASHKSQRTRRRVTEQNRKLSSVLVYAVGANIMKKAVSLPHSKDVKQGVSEKHHPQWSSWAETYFHAHSHFSKETASLSPWDL